MNHILIALHSLRSEAVIFEIVASEIPNKLFHTLIGDWCNSWRIETSYFFNILFCFCNGSRMYSMYSTLLQRFSFFCTISYLQAMNTSRWRVIPKTNLTTIHVKIFSWLLSKNTIGFFLDNKCELELDNGWNLFDMFLAFHKNVKSSCHPIIKSTLFIISKCPVHMPIFDFPLTCSIQCPVLLLSSLLLSCLHMEHHFSLQWNSHASVVPLHFVTLSHGLLPEGQMNLRKVWNFNI